MNLELTRDEFRIVMCGLSERGLVPDFSPPAVSTLYTHTHLFRNTSGSRASISYINQFHERGPASLARVREALGIDISVAEMAEMLNCSDQVSLVIFCFCDSGSEPCSLLVQYVEDAK